MIRALASFFLLLGLEARLAFRVGGDPQRRGRLAVLAILGVLMMAVSWVGASFIANFEPEPTPLALTIATAALAFIGTLMLGHALIAATEAVYSRGDLDLLLSSPVPSSVVLTVRALGVAVRVGAVYFILISGLLISLAIMGAWRWLSIAPALIGLALLATAGGLVLTLILFATVGARATRVIAQVMGALIGASLILIFQAPNFMASGQRGAAMQQMLAALQSLNIPSDSPVFLPARAMLGDTTATGLWIGLTFLSFALAAAGFGQRFARDAASAYAVAPKRRGAARLLPFRGGVTASLLRKEWRLLARDPVLLSQILLQLIYLVPMIYYLVRGLDDGPANDAFLGVMAGAISVIAASLSASLVWITVSAEDAPDLIAAAPLSAGLIERAKLAGAVTPVLILVAAASGLLAAQSIPAAVWTFAGASCAAVSAALVGVWHQEPGTRKEFRRRPRASWSAQLGQGFVGMGWASVSGICAGGLPPALALIPGLIALGLMLALHESRRKPIAA